VRFNDRQNNCKNSLPLVCSSVAVGMGGGE
jgi:hypothetical protein